MSSFDSRRGLMNGGMETKIKKLDRELKEATYDPEFHGDMLLGDPLQIVTGYWNDISKVLAPKNLPQIGSLAYKAFTGQGLDIKSGAQLVGSLPENGKARIGFTKAQVTEKYNKMLHPPLTYLGDAFQYRTADGKFNNVLVPHLGQAGAPYAKTVPSKTHLLGAQPDPGDIFDRLMARDTGGRKSESGLSSMLIYHATIIIHDIFRTNNADKNISDSSSYLDLSPLYGYTEEMQRKVRDDKYKLGLLKPDTFAEDRLLRQPPGVCIMLVMYNRYHNYAATQLRRINENGRFSVPLKYAEAKLVAVAEQCIPAFREVGSDLQAYLGRYKTAWKNHRHGSSEEDLKGYSAEDLQKKIESAIQDDKTREVTEEFKKEWQAAWNKLDDDLFNTARLITCGMYVNVSIHDYLRALMGFHQYNTTFTLDPRVAINDPKDSKKDTVSRGIGNQVTVEFNLLYRFHCAISMKDERYTEDFMIENYKKYLVPEGEPWDPKTMTLNQFFKAMQMAQIESNGKDKTEPWDQVFGLSEKDEVKFTRNKITKLFNDEQMVEQLLIAMDDPISNFGPRNVPRCLKSVEILGMLQARKWEVGTLNDFRDFFNMPRHKTFASISGNKEIQNALRDLYDHPDKVELYPGAFCEGDSSMGLDPGPSESNSALWTAIFSDAITLVRSDRFYTVDWNTNSLTSWGMKEVTPDSDVLKSSVFHRLIQRAFPGWFPYDSIRFFHPFYTKSQNEKFAKAQGYWPDFDSANPRKPEKPVYLNDYEAVKAVLDGGPDAFVNPAAFDNGLPTRVKEILNPGRTLSKGESKEKPWADDRMVLDYFTQLTRQIIKREIIKMDAEKPTYQIDVTRDLAIPVVTRFVADFLGVGHRIKADPKDGGEYSENEIYQHITNCQVFLAYNVDETKMWKRRAAFKSSMQFLFNLAESGNVRDATMMPVTRWARKLFGQGTESRPKSIKELGKLVAQRILESQKDAGRAAAVLLLTALDGAYNSVLAFSTVLDHFIAGLDQCVEAPHKKVDCEWIKIQELALSDKEEDTKKIQKYVLEAQRLTVKLPVVRKVSHKTDIVIKGHTFKPGETVVCDIFAASQITKEDEHNPKGPRLINKEKNLGLPEDDYLAYSSSLSGGQVHFNARKSAVLGLTAMIKVLGQLKNLRRGHDTQGKLKRIRVDQTSEGYANFMAPMRVEDIRREAIPREAKRQKTDEVNSLTQTESYQAKSWETKKDIFDDDVLKPQTDTYLTAEWDEMIPFPTTWKVRFDGYGQSDYDWEAMGLARIPSDPLYQPQGASHIGGSFADTVCICSAAGDMCNCAKLKTTDPVKESTEPGLKSPPPALGVRVGGCGLPHPGHI